VSQVVDHDSLVAYITALFDRVDDTVFTGQIDTFIGLAEDTWTPMLLNRQMEATATLTTDSTGLVALPADYYRPRSVSGIINGANTYLPPLGPTANAGLYPASTTDTPNYWQIVGNNFYLVPGQVATITLDYWAKFVGLSASNQTNWIMDNHPTLYVMSVTAQGHLFNNDFANAASFDAKATAILQQITDYFALDYYNTSEVVIDTVTP